jgi:hypothetical protein
MNEDDEIFVTPEMIEAGKDVIASQWGEFVGLSGYKLWDSVMTDVFRAMTKAQKS